MLHRLIVGPGSLWRFYALFAVAFTGYAIGSIGWMALRGNVGSLAGLLPGHINFARNGRGEMQFGAVDLTLDWRLNTKGSRVEFTFEGFDEGDEVTGRGWAELDGGKLTGRIAFHQGDESGFVAQKTGKPRS